MKTIRDPVHGDIELSEVERAVVDSEEMQRLRRVKQLSFCSLVYPGANHTRFEHSLGTMHMAGRMAGKLGIEAEPLRLAGLVHDIGHFPFSHSLEGAFGVNHEDNLSIVLKGPVGDALQDGGFDPKRILRLAHGEGEGKIISSQIDADRIDYLLRDSHYTGVAYGVIDVDRILNVIGFDGKEIYFNKKGIIALEALLIGRNQMYEAVYFHHAVRVADAMLQEAARQVRDKIKITELLKMGDEEFKVFARAQSPVAKELLDLLDKRRLYKVACMYSAKAECSTSELAKKAGLKPWQVLVNTVAFNRFAFSIMVRDETGLKRITEVSKTAKSLEEEIHRMEESLVCVPEECKEKVSRLCKEL